MVGSMRGGGPGLSAFMPADGGGDDAIRDLCQLFLCESWGQRIHCCVGAQTCSPIAEISTFMLQFEHFIVGSRAAKSVSFAMATASTPKLSDHNEGIINSLRFQTAAGGECLGTNRRQYQYSVRSRNFDSLLSCSGEC